MPKLPKLSGILSLFTLFLFTVVAYSQGTVATPLQTSNGAGSGNGVSQNSGSISVSASPGMVGGMIAGFGGGMGGVKGQPFSADVIDEDDKYLADGNHIHRENHGKIFRDSEGRSRNEMEIGAMVAGGTPFVHVTIFDPVQNVFILLDPQRKMATVSHFKGNLGAVGHARAPQPAAGATKSSTSPAAADSQALLQNLREMQGVRPARQRAREDLGTMEIDGFTVKGFRLTMTTPAGDMGNDKPMVSTTEQWFSEDLKTDLLIKSSNPESGQHTHRIVNIRSGDPDPLLFQVPADYTVKEQPQQ